MIQLSPESVEDMDPIQRILSEPVSSSRLNTFHSCRMRFYFRYILQLEKPVAAALHVGKAVHQVLQHWNKQRWLKKPTHPEQLREVLEDAWNPTETSEPVSFDSPEEERLEKEKAWAILEVYFQQTPVPLEETPEAVEVLVETDLHKHGLPSLRGVIDLIRPGGVIVDFKTTGTTPHEQLVLHRNERQLSCYALLYREATGRREKGFELHHLVKTKTPKLVVTRHRPMTAVQESKLLRSIESFVNGVERADWVPSPGLQCSSCEYFNECRGAL